MRRALRLVVWGLAALALALALVQAFVGGVYLVESRSMEPTLRGATPPGGGEWVFVRYDDAPDLARYDLVVYRDPDGGSDPLVKRVAALPGERVEIRGGDLFVDGALPPPDGPRPAPVPLFDDRLQDPREAFRWDPDLWTPGDDAWILDARGAEAPHDDQLLLFGRGLSDRYLGPDGRPAARPHAVPVRDGAIACELRFERPGGTWRFELRELGDLFRCELEPAADGTAAARITRFSPRLGDEGERLAEGTVALELGRWVRARFSNVDDRLALELGTAGRVLGARYDGNHPAPELAEGRTRGPQVALGGAGLRVAVRALRVERDLFHGSRGKYGVEPHPLQLGPREYFLLGDNSADSRDSRQAGPIPREALLGVPVAVVWPLGRARRLRGATDPGPAGE